jgi:hypothetical protein
MTQNIRLTCSLAQIVSISHEAAEFGFPSLLLLGVLVLLHDLQVEHNRQDHRRVIRWPAAGVQ